jgi:competence protein ComEA
VTRLRTEGGVEAPADARAAAAVCLGVLLVAVTALSAPWPSSGPRLPAVVPTLSAGQAEEAPVDGGGRSPGGPATPPERSGAAHAGVAAERSQPLDINRADASALQRLRGVGPALAERIIRYRETHGAFRTREDLLEVPGIGARRYARLHGLVRTVDAP